MNPFLREELVEVIKEGIPPSDETAVRAAAEYAYVKIDACLPTIRRSLEALGNSDEALNLALVQWTLESAHAELQKVWNGEI